MAGPPRTAKYNYVLLSKNHRLLCGAVASHVGLGLLGYPGRLKVDFIAGYCVGLLGHFMRSSSCMAMLTGTNMNYGQHCSEGK